MGNLAIIGGCFVFLWLCLPSPGQCQVTVYVTSFPVQPVENGNVTLTCFATGFDPNAHYFSWQRFYGSSYLDVKPDKKFSFSFAFLNKRARELDSHNLHITRLLKSDEGLYKCIIRVKDKDNIIGNGQVYFTVNSTEEFPVCFPDGPADVNEGDILTCTTVIDERTPVVSDTDNPNERPDWVKAPLELNESGSRLQKSVNVSDDGVAFYCFSITPENQNWTSLSCKIGPLTVIPSPTTKQPQIGPLTVIPHPSTTPTTTRSLSTDELALSVGVITGITLCLILLVVLVTILVLYFVYRRKRTSHTTSDTGPNQQNLTHNFATSILDDTQVSSTANAELHNYVYVL